MPAFVPALCPCAVSAPSLWRFRAQLRAFPVGASLFGASVLALPAQCCLPLTGKGPQTITRLLPLFSAVAPRTSGTIHCQSASCADGLLRTIAHAWTVTTPASTYGAPAYRQIVFVAPNHRDRLINVFCFSTSAFCVAYG